MPLRQVAGEINRARAVKVLVYLTVDDEEGIWVDLSKVAARDVVAQARDRGLSEMGAESRKGILYLSEIETSDLAVVEGEIHEDDENADDPDDPSGEEE